MKVTSLCVWVQCLSEVDQASQRQRYCVNCGETFTATGCNHRYCSACGEERARVRNREKAKRYLERHREKLREKRRERYGARHKGKPQPNPETGYIGNGVFQRKCRSCGETFKTGSAKGYYCRECQKIRTIQLERKRQMTLRYVEKHRRRLKIWNMRVRNTKKYCKMGTFDNKEYLQIVDNGRVFGALLLQKGISINSKGRFTKQGWMERSVYVGIDKRILRIDGNVYCGECGADVIKATQNNSNYTIPAELCCKSCGLVYELDDLAQLT